MVLSARLVVGDLAHLQKAFYDEQDEVVGNSLAIIWQMISVHNYSTKEQETSLWGKFIVR
ncbi:MAG: hypothetical protein NVS3B11_13940 [Collimonas sp.]